ncbi:hypothetical protein AtNW77_Chr4g0290771 [Arabidopsis thaliana]|uniref:Uncharacterized protein n=2 Tax=Arabidopsis TaxID=3701 RepID=A0A178V5K9_ARATH|nr:hypothetical protein ISN45_At04g016450 [Arabidopsis thaliana x Arabidopsis arenosa]OAP01061.1 hypothetical protein AXX17_AT4G18340 [Arabidopsis thaliana]
MACEVDTDLSKAGDSTSFNPPLPKKPKINVEKTDLDAMVLPGLCPAGDRMLRYGKLSDPEYVRQRQVFDDQFEDSEGFDVEWDSFDYKFFAMKFEWAGEGDLDYTRSNLELRTLLIDAAMKDHDDDYDTKLEFVDYVSANVMPCKGYMF